MKTVRVTYTVKPEFAETNKKNIEAVMKEVRALNNPGFKYATFLQEDGKTFMHFALADSEENSKILFDLPAFKKFQQELKASNPETPPKSEQLSLVASGYSIF